MSNEERVIEKFYLHSTDSYKPKYQYLLNKLESLHMCSVKRVEKHTATLMCLMSIQMAIYIKILKTRRSKTRRKYLNFSIWLGKKIIHPKVTGLITRDRKVNISVTFIMKPYFKGSLRH